MTGEETPRGKPVRLLPAVLGWVAVAGSSNWLGIMMQRELVR